MPTFSWSRRKSTMVAVPWIYGSNAMCAKRFQFSAWCRVSLSARTEHIALVGLHSRQPRAVGGDFVALAKLRPHRAPGQRLGVLLQREAAGVVARVLGVLQPRARLEQAEQQRLAGVARADRPGRDAVDRSVEEIHAHRDAVERAALRDFRQHVLGRVVERDHVVAVPAHAARHVKQQVRHEEQQRRDLVGDVLRGMKMPRVEAVADPVLHREAEIELVRAGGVALHADAEELALDRVEVERPVHVGREDRLQRLQQAATGRGAISRRVLVAVGYPDVGDGGRAERAAELRADAARGDAVVDPEAPHRRISVREREAVGRERMPEAARIEVHAPLARAGPVHPRLEVGDGERVAVHAGGVVGRVGRVQVEPQRAGHETGDLLEIGGELGKVARLAGIAAGGDAAGAGVAGGVFKAAHVVALPAVQRDGNGGEGREGGVGIDAPRGKLFAGGGVGGGHGEKCKK